jgi:hypothetical protein
MCPPASPPRPRGREHANGTRSALLTPPERDQAKQDAHVVMRNHAYSAHQPVEAHQRTACGGGCLNAATAHKCAMAAVPLRRRNRRRWSRQLWAGNKVVAVLAGEAIAIRASEQAIQAGTAVDRIRIYASREPVVPSLAKQQVDAGTAASLIVASTTTDFLVSAGAPNDVVAIADVRQRPVVVPTRRNGTPVTPAARRSWAASRAKSEPALQRATCAFLASRGAGRPGASPLRREQRAVRSGR